MTNGALLFESISQIYTDKFQQNVYPLSSLLSPSAPQCFSVHYTQPHIEALRDVSHRHIRIQRARTFTLKNNFPLCHSNIHCERGAYPLTRRAWYWCAAHSHFNYIEDWAEIITHVGVRHVCVGVGEERSASHRDICANPFSILSFVRSFASIECQSTRDKVKRPKRAQIFCVRQLEEWSRWWECERPMPATRVRFYSFSVWINVRLICAGDMYQLWHLGCVQTVEVCGCGAAGGQVFVTDGLGDIELRTFFRIKSTQISHEGNHCKARFDYTIWGWARP